MIRRSTLGSDSLARQIADRARQYVPAYRAHLQRHGIAIDAPFESLPPTDKTSYLLPAKYADLLGDDYQQAYTIFASSGSSGHAFYWPQLKNRSGPGAADALRVFLERSFQIDRRPTLAIVGLALGSWIGGDQVSWALKSVAVQTPYPFTVFSPGSKHEEILAMLRAAGPHVEQFLLFVCPSAIGHLKLRAQQNGIPWPADKLRFVVIGEPFPESLRQTLQAESGRPPQEPVILSVYGSADTGVIGAESAASAAIRAALSSRSDACEALGLSWPPPHLFHLAADDVYLESINGELHITRWQGIPLVRYNLHDAAALLSWRDLLAALPSQTLGAAAEALANLPDLIAISGRADRCLILCGTNLSESMLDAAVRSPAVADRLTGAYRAKITFEGARQRLALDVETKPNVDVEPDQLYRDLIGTLGEAQPEFADDWQNVYKTWDDEPTNRILAVTTLPWPALSDRGAIKHRGIQA